MLLFSVRTTHKNQNVLLKGGKKKSCTWNCAKFVYLLPFSNRSVSSFEPIFHPIFFSIFFCFLLFRYWMKECMNASEMKKANPLNVIESNVSHSKFIEPFHPVLNSVLVNFPSFLPSTSFQLTFVYLSNDFSDAPTCRAGQKTAYGSSIGETIAVSCDVDANPSNNIMFYWIFRSFHSNESITVSSQSSFVTNNPLHHENHQQQQQLIQEQIQHGYRVKGHQINQEKGETHRKESIFHTNNSSNKKGVPIISSFLRRRKNLRYSHILPLHHQDPFPYPHPHHLDCTRNKYHHHPPLILPLILVKVRISLASRAREAMKCTAVTTITVTVVGKEEGYEEERRMEKKVKVGEIHWHFPSAMSWSWGQFLLPFPHKSPQDNNLHWKGSFEKKKIFEKE